MARARTIAIGAVPAMATIAWQWHGHRVRQVTRAPVLAPDLPGSLHHVSRPWGCLSYRLIPGDPSITPLVLVHGWGRTGDSSWLPLVEHLRPTVLTVDLPGHGRSRLAARFTMAAAADAVTAAVSHAGLRRPILVGHSMGGPVALSAIRLSDPETFSALVGIATSAYWVAPKHRAKLAAAPYVLAPRSPILLRAQLRERARAPEDAGRIAWEYSVRPDRHVLLQAAAALRKFDARRWGQLEVPPATWVVTASDGVIDPRDQRRSATLLDAQVIEVPSDHSVVSRIPDVLARILHAVDSRPSGPFLVAV